MKEIIQDYTNGNYHDLCAWSQRRFGGTGVFEANGLSDIIIKGIESRERENAERLYTEIVSRSEIPCDLFRTEKVYAGGMHGTDKTVRSERWGLAPEVGTVLNWGVKSTSSDPEWIRNVASNCAEGIKGMYSDDRLIAYHIENATRYLDIAHLSKWNQKEALVAGSYEVVKVRRELMTTDINTLEPIKISPRQRALRDGLEIEYFTSKKGEEMAKFGTHTYPVSKLDIPSMPTSEMIYLMRNIIHIWLKEL